MDVITNNMLRQALPLFNVLAGVLIVLGLGTILVLGKPVIIPLALATLLSFALAPVASSLQRAGVGRGLSVLGSVLLALLVISSISYVVFSQASELAVKLPEYRDVIHNKIQALSSGVRGDGPLRRAAEIIRELAGELRPDAGETPALPPAVIVRNDESGLGRIGAYLTPLLKPIATFAAVFLMTAFMLGQREDLRNRIIKLMGVGDIQQTTAAMNDAGTRVGRILLAQLSVNAAYGLAISTGLALIGVPSPFLWGVLAGVMRFVPYIGTLIGMLPPLLVAFAFDPNWNALFWTLGLFAIVNPIVGQMIEPVLYGRSAGLSPLAVIVFATIWAFLWGPIGLVLSNPLTICLVVTGRHVKRLAFLDILLGDKPALLPHEMFYQRMLAGDPREASQQAARFLKGRALSTYYDEIALEALRRAHLDIVRGTVSGERLALLVQSTRDLVKSLDDVHTGDPALSRIGAETAAAFETLRDKPSVLKKVSSEALALEWRGAAPVAVLYGNHPLDELAALMLAQSLTKHGLAARISTMDAARKASEAERKDVALVCLSFVEPLSILHLRLSTREVRQRRPGVKIMLCIWQQTDTRLIVNFTRQLRVDKIVTTTSEALEAAALMAQTPGQK